MRNTQGKPRKLYKPLPQPYFVPYHSSLQSQLLYTLNSSKFSRSPTNKQQTCLTPAARISLPRLRRRLLPTPPSPPKTRSRRPSPIQLTVSPAARSPMTTRAQPKRPSTRASVLMTMSPTVVPPRQLARRSRTPSALVKTRA